MGLKVRAHVVIQVMPWFATWVRLTTLPVKFMLNSGYTMHAGTPEDNLAGNWFVGALLRDTECVKCAWTMHWMCKEHCSGTLCVYRPLHWFLCVCRCTVCVQVHWVCEGALGVYRCTVCVQMPCVCAGALCTCVHVNWWTTMLCTDANSSTSSLQNTEQTKNTKPLDPQIKQNTWVVSYQNSEPSKCNSYVPQWPSCWGHREREGAVESVFLITKVNLPTWWK